jgi:hypothetical protein
VWPLVGATGALNANNGIDCDGLQLPFAIETTAHDRISRR